MFVLFLSSFSQAEEYYNAEGVASHSKLFRSANESLMPLYSKLESEIARWEEGLRKEEISVYLINDPNLIAQYKEEHRRFTELRIEFENRAYYTVSTYESVFTQAMEAELQNYPNAVSCSEQMGLMSMDQGEDCRGQNISQAIAEEIDKSEQLKAKIETTNAVPWPNIKVPQQPVVLEGSYVNIQSLAQNYYGDRLKLIASQKEQALLEILPGLKSEIPSEKEQAIADAKQIRNAYSVEVAQIGEHIIKAMSIVEENSKLCSHSAELGGCTGTNRTLQTIELIDSKRKARKWVSK